MAAKKKTKLQKSKARLRKGKTWILGYTGTKIIEAYGKCFHVDPKCAERELSKLGALDPQKLADLKKADKERKLAEREAKKLNAEKKMLKAKATPKKNVKRVCINCGAKMKQQFIGLEHCKCGTSWKKDIGYFERTQDMVFALERRKVGNKVKQYPIIRYKLDI